MFPKDSLTKQLDYIKNTKNPRELGTKQWINWLQEIKTKMYFMNLRNYEFNNVTISCDAIDQKLPLDWIVDWRKSRIGQ